MKFLVICAGIPGEWYDSVKKNADTIVGSNGVFLGAPLRESPDRRYRYKVSDINRLLRRAGEFFLGVDDPGLRETGLVLSFIDHDSGTERNLVESFFPFALCDPVRAEICPNKSRQYREQAKNEFMNELRLSILRLKKAVRPLRPEIQSSASRTPLLLPYRNFRSRHLNDCLKGLFYELVGSDDPVAMIQGRVKLFRKIHNLQRVAGATRTCFVNVKNVAFVPPGTALHGFARPYYRPPHFITCLLNGRTRLGAPYNWSFHYDCVFAGDKGHAGRLRGNFPNCHGAEDSYRGNPHLNIAPNDFVRS